jgi:hypothetical protein
MLVVVSCALIATVTFVSGPRFNGSIDDGNIASVAGFDDHVADLTGPFTDHSSDPNPGDTIFDWHRTFDDGNSSIEPNPIHTSAAGGTDRVGAIDRASATRAVTQPNAPPIVTLTAPPDGAVYLAPAEIVVQTIASDPDGTVEKVLVYVNDSEGKGIRGKGMTPERATFTFHSLAQHSSAHQGLSPFCIDAPAN